MSAAIKFTCPHCERICKVPAELAGKQGRCPGCKKGLEVPLETAEHLRSGRLPQRTSGSGAVDSGRSGRTKARASSRQGKVEGARRTGKQGRVSERMERELGPMQEAAPPAEEAGPGPTRMDESPEEEWDESETQALVCPACKLEVLAGASVCPYCKYQLRKERGSAPMHWTIYLAFLLCPCFPLFGMVLARIGLEKAHERQSHETAAWIAVIVNGINLLIGMVFMLNRLF